MKIKSLLILLFNVWFFIITVSHPFATEIIQDIKSQTDNTRQTSPASHEINIEVLTRYAYYACMSDKDDNDLCKKESGLIAEFISEHQKLFSETYEKNNCADSKKRFKEGFAKECLKKSLEEVQGILSKQRKDYDNKMKDMKVVKCLASQNVPANADSDVYTQKAEECRKYVEAISRKKDDDGGSSFLGGLIGTISLLASIAAPFIPVTAFGGSAISAGIAQGATQLGLKTAGEIMAGVGVSLWSEPADIASPPEDMQKIKGFLNLQCISDYYPDASNYGKCENYTQSLSHLLMVLKDDQKYKSCMNRNKERFEKAKEENNKDEMTKVFYECEDEAIEKDISLDRQVVAKNMKYLVLMNRNIDKIMAARDDDELFKIVNELKIQSASAKEEPIPQRQVSEDDLKKNKKIAERKFQGIWNIATKQCKEYKTIPEDPAEFVFSTEIADHLVLAKCSEWEEGLILKTKKRGITSITRIDIPK
jgi:hypothetical protein